MSPPLEFSGPLQRAPGHVLGEPWDYSRNALRVLPITPGALREHSGSTLGALWEHSRSTLEHSRSTPTAFPNLMISSCFYTDKRIDYSTDIYPKCSQHSEKKLIILHILIGILKNSGACLGWVFSGLTLSKNG